jgi:hypothetical protein
MKPVKKLIETIVLVVLIIVVLLLIVFSLFGEHVIKVAIETAGTKALNVGVNIDDLNLSVFRGSVGIKGLVIGNPPGYEHKNLMELNEGRVKTSLKSLMSDTVEIESINFDGINLFMEQKGLTNNLQDILKSIPKAKEKPKPAEPAKEPKKLHVKQLKITGVKVNVKLLPVPGKATTVKLELDPIEMNDLGSDDKLTTAKLISKVTVAISKGVVKKGAGVLPDEMINTLSDTLGRFTDISKAAMKEGQKLLESGKEESEKMLETGKETGQGILEGFKGILKSKEEE